MAKQAKLPQTDWTRGGMQISNAAVPQYTESINRLGGYLSDPSAQLDKYLNQYYGANAIQNQDMLRAYNRAMGDQVGRNYAATGGGYTTSGQRAWNDKQSTWNDLVARLNQYGVTSARNMSDQDIINEINAQTALSNAYNLGRNYSAIETQNALADQANKNWFSSALSGLGNAAMAVAPFTGVAAPFVAGAGALASGAGAVTGQDFGSANAGYASIYGGGNIGAGVQNNNTFTNLANNLNQYDWGKIFNKSNNSNSNQVTNNNVGGTYFNTSLGNVPTYDALMQNFRKRVGG